MPVRSCIICRKKGPKSELTRLFIDQDQELAADIKGNRPGRGAYICGNLSCREKLILGKRLDSVFRTRVRSISRILET